MFTVIDKKTGKYPNLEKIALKEDWAKNLIYCDMEGFFLSEDGNIVLADECGNFVYPPHDRFIVLNDDCMLGQESSEFARVVRCKNCKYSDDNCVVKDMLWCNNNKSPDYAVNKEFYCAAGKEREGGK